MLAPKRIRFFGAKRIRGMEEFNSVTDSMPEDTKEEKQKKKRRGKKRKRRRESRKKRKH